jgi:hypothetical protein
LTLQILNPKIETNQRIRTIIRDKKNKPNAKQKVKIAEKMFPMIAEIARVPNCLTLSTRLPKEPNKDEREGQGFGTKSI